MAPEARAELAQELTKLSVEEKLIQQEIRNLDRQIQWMEKKRGLEAEVSSAEQRCEAAARNREKHREELNRYALCLPAQDIRPFYDRLAQIKQSRTAQQRDLENLALKMETLEARLVRMDQALSGLREEAGKAEEKRRETETLIVEQVVPLDRDIMALERELTELAARSKAGAGKCRTLEAQLVAYDKEAEACTAERDQALEFLETHKARGGMGELLPLAETLLKQRTGLMDKGAGLTRALEKNDQARRAADQAIAAGVRESGRLNKEFENLSARTADLETRLAELAQNLEVPEPDKAYRLLGRTSGPQEQAGGPGRTIYPVPAKAGSGQGRSSKDPNRACRQSCIPSFGRCDPSQIQGQGS